VGYRKTVFAVGEIYHLASRTIAGEPLFVNSYDYLRFLKALGYYHYQNVPLRFSYLKSLALTDQKRIIKSLKKQNQCLLEVIAFCLMPNHFHILGKQLVKNGISIFMSKLKNSYAKYFNTKHSRQGSLFQSMFKAVRIETDEQLIHVSRYIHLNPFTAYLCSKESLLKYSWSSLSHYLGLKFFDFLKPSAVLSLFKNKKSYKEFVFDQADYQRDLAHIKHLILEK